MSHSEYPSDGLLYLRPDFDEDEHGTYVEVMLSALNDETPSRPLNIALTGSYGSGKSSVLEGVKSALAGTAFLSVSIPTFQGEGDAPRTEDIQKEIVKQLLYREAPSTLNGSRFRRIEIYSFWRAILLSAVISAGLVLLSAITGATARVEEMIRDPFELGIFTLLCIVVLIVIFTALQWHFHNRFRLKALSAGPATIDASDVGDYFDRFLDEIVFFFSATSYSVVVFEDLDRFKQISIFEELRELNALLNNSRQVGRPIRFVYALRDSVFQQLGDGGSRPGHVESEAASSRAKFFDLVLPVVPFATKRSAVDLWYRVISPVAPALRADAFAAAADHVQDMRVIKAVRNEFVVFRTQIAKNAIKDLRDDALFALMVYKAVELKDFEAIRDGSSYFDAAEAWRRTKISEWTTYVDALIASQALADTASERREALAGELGGRLVAGIDRSLRVAGQPASLTEIRIGKNRYAEDDYGAVSLWSSLMADPNAATVVIGGQVIAIDSEDLLGILGVELPLSEWERPTVGPLNLDALEELRRKITSASVADLLHLASAVESSREGLEEELATQVESPLARTLLLSGLIDQNFSLYASRFYGDVVSQDAMNFVLHVVNPNSIDMNASLPTNHDVTGVFIEAGPEFLRTPSALNLDLVNNLIDDDRLEPILQQLAAGGIDANNFLLLYARRGEYLDALANRLAPIWPGSLSWIAGVEGISDSKRLACMNSALGAIDPETRYEVNEPLAVLLRQNLAELDPFRDERYSAVASALAAILRRCQVEVDDLSPLSIAVRDAIIRDGNFGIGERNLRAAFGDESEWSLDKVHAVSERAAAHLVRNASEYLATMPRRSWVLGDQAVFDRMLTFIAEDAGIDELAQFIRRSDPTLRVIQIEDVPQATWPTLVETQRVQDRLTNWVSYAAAHGIDSILVTSLSRYPVQRDISAVAQEARVSFGIEVLKTPIAVTKKARLVASLELESYLSVAQVGPIKGPLYSLLLQKNVIADSASMLDSLRGLGWQTRGPYIARSKLYASYVAEVQFLASELGQLFSDAQIPSAAKRATLAAAAALEPAFNAFAATQAALFIARSRPTLSRGQLDILARRGCSIGALAQVFGTYRFTDERVVELISLLPSKAAGIASRGRSKPRVPNTPTMVSLLLRLKGMGIVSSWRLIPSGELRVERHH